jgi:hypothetical protein
MAVEVDPPEIIPGPDQLYVALPVVEEPVSVAVLALHVIVCGLPALALGAPAAALTTTVPVAEHPFDRSVTVTVYVPAAFTVGVAVDPPETIPGPAQLNEVPLVEDDPLSVTDGLVHVRVWLAPALAFGTELF